MATPAERLRTLVADDESPVDANTVPDAYPVQLILLEDCITVIAHPHGDAVALALVATLLDLVAGDRATDGARGRRDVVATAAADLWPSTPPMMPPTTAPAPVERPGPPITSMATTRPESE
jgi:hypothetical protein